MQQILLKSKIILGNQEGKRRELANKLQALVSKSEADVTTTALQWNTVRKPLRFQCNLHRSTVNHAKVRTPALAFLHSVLLHYHEGANTKRLVL